MNIHDLLNFDLKRKPAPEEIKDKLLDLGFVQTGSRRMLPQAAKEFNSDWDFMAPDNESFRKTLHDLDFKEFPFSNGYGDDYSTSLFKNQNIEVVLKKSEFYPAFVQMWERMAPEFYKKYIWKKTPGVTRELIKERIDFLINYNL